MNALRSIEAGVRLAAFIADAAGASHVAIVETSPLSGGAIQENWRVVVAVHGGDFDGRLSMVLRCDAPTVVAESLGRLQEHALLKAAFDAGVTVPEPLWACNDVSVLGRPFFLMCLVGGTADAMALTRDDKLGGDRHELAARLGRELALIHTIRPPRPGLGLQVSEEAPALRLVAKARAWLDKAPGAHPILEWALRWLELNAPPRGDIALCHRDFRTGNYMVDERGLTGVLDWEFAGFSDPMEDIGWFCAKCWRFGRPDREAGGIGNRLDFYAGYESISGIAIDTAVAPYWEAMAHLNWAIIALQQAARHVGGQESSLMLALTAHIVPELEWELLEMIDRARNDRSDRNDHIHRSERHDR